MSEILFSSNNELMNLIALNFGLISPEDMNFTGSIKVVPEMVNTIASLNVSLPEARFEHKNTWVIIPMSWMQGS